MSLKLPQSNIYAGANAVLLPHKEQSGKWDAIGSTSLSNLKIIFTMLIKAIAIHVQVSIIEVKKLSFKGLFAKTGPVILFQQFNGGRISFQKLLT